MLARPSTVIIVYVIGCAGVHVLTMMNANRYFYFYFDCSKLKLIISCVNCVKIDISKVG